MSDATVDVQQTILDVYGDVGQTLRNSTKYLTFHIDDCIYGVDISNIKEIIEYSAFTRVPMAPRHIRGVINIRGKVVPVIDLAERLNKTSQAVSRRTCIIIASIEDEGEDVDLGFLVDMVDEVIDLDKNTIEPAPSFGTEIRGDFIIGMGKVDNKFFVLLDLDQVMSIEELSELVANYVHDI